MVDAGVAGETVYPGGEAALPLKGGQSPPGIEKGLLGCILGVLRVAQHPQRQGINTVLIVQHQLFKGSLIACFGPGDQLRFCHLLHLLPPLS